MKNTRNRFDFKSAMDTTSQTNNLVDTIIQHGIILISSSNPPDQLLSNPFYHQHFMPSIKQTALHIDVTALTGNREPYSTHAQLAKPT